MGFNDIHVYDFDVIEEHNIPNQLYKESQIDQLKVDALHHVYKTFFNDEDDEPRIITHNEKLTADSDPLSGVIISAVDTMSSRKELYESLYKFNPSAKLWIEGRISLYGAYVYTVGKELFQFDEYEKTLYDDTEAEVSACGISQTALPAAINCASVMVMQMIDWFSGNKPLNEIQYSIPWMTAFTKEWKE
jgi:molybdopterin/thiamine biosynthesis adenylyltransferase